MHVDLHIQLHTSYMESLCSLDKLTELEWKGSMAGASSGSWCHQDEWTAFPQPSTGGKPQQAIEVLFLIQAPWEIEKSLAALMKGFKNFLVEGSIEQQS